MNYEAEKCFQIIPRLAEIREGVKARQVTTHTHEAAVLPGYKRFRHIGHCDFKRIPRGSTWEFPLLEGPGCVSAIWMTVAGRLTEAFLRRRIPAHRWLWISIYYDDENLLRR